MRGRTTAGGLLPGHAGVGSEESCSWKLGTAGGLLLGHAGMGSEVPCSWKLRFERRVAGIEAGGAGRGEGVARNAESIVLCPTSRQNTAEELGRSRIAKEQVLVCEKTDLTDERRREEQAAASAPFRKRSCKLN